MAPQRHQKAPKRIQYGAQSGSMAIRTPPPRWPSKRPKMVPRVPKMEPMGGQWPFRPPQKKSRGHSTPHPPGNVWKAIQKAQNCAQGYQKMRQWGANGHSNPPGKLHRGIPTPPGMCRREVPPKKLHPLRASIHIKKESELTTNRAQRKRHFGPLETNAGGNQGVTPKTLLL